MEISGDKKTKRRVSAKNKFLLLGVVLFLFTLAGILYMGWDCDLIWNCKMVSASSVILILLLTIMCYLCEKIIETEDKKTGKEEKKCGQYCLLIGVSYLLSFGCIVLSKHTPVYAYWMIGGFLIAAVIHAYLGAIFQIYFSLLFAVISQQEIDEFAITFLMALGFCFLAPYLRRVFSVGYVVMLSLACNGMAIILEHSFNLAYILRMESAWSEISMFLTIVGSAFLAWIFRGYIYTGKFSFIRSGIHDFLDNEDEEDVWEYSDFVRIGDMDTIKEKEADTSLNDVLDENFSLKKDLENKLPQVYKHSKQVADLAKGAANVIGADEQLVYAGGIYHEAGKLIGKNYVEHSVELAKKNAFPESLIQVISEHNVTCKIPTTKEAAILMLADSVVFMLEHMDTYKKEQMKDKSILVKRIFELRFTKGELDDSQFSIKDYKELQTFFCQWVQEKNV